MSIMRHRTIHSVSACETPLHEHVVQFVARQLDSAVYDMLYNILALKEMKSVFVVV